jgi:hypothetical protein
MRDIELQLMDYWEDILAETPLPSAEKFMDTTWVPFDFDDVGDIVDDEPPNASRGRRLLVAAATVIVLVVVGISWFISSRDDLGLETIDDPVEVNDVEPAPDEREPDEPAGPTGELGTVLGPGAWSVIATPEDSEISTDELAEIVNEVSKWDGVVEVVAANDVDAWTPLVGPVGPCDGQGVELCGPGVAILSGGAWIEGIVQRLNAQYSASVVSVRDAPEEFVHAHVTAAVEEASPVPLGFDTASLGTELVLDGPFVNFADDEYVGICEEPESGRCAVSVAYNSGAGVYRSGIYVDHRSDGDPELVLTWRGPNPQRYSALYPEVADILVDSVGRGGAIAGFNSGVFAAGALPLDAAVVAGQLTDGSTVWQRPLGGMALIVDGEDRILDLNEDLRVLDSSGDQIMSIRKTVDGVEVFDLRVRTQVASPLEPIRLEAAQVLDVGESVAIPWGKAVVETAEAVWLATGGTLVRVDTATFEQIHLPIVIDSSDVTVDPTADSQLSESTIRDLLSTGNAIWVLVDADRALSPSSVILRIDGATNEISHRFKIAAHDGFAADGFVWFSTSTQIVRIDVETFTLETFPLAGGGSSADQHNNLRWLGKADGALWLSNVVANAYRLIRVDIRTGASEFLPISLDRHGAEVFESHLALADDSVWIYSWWDGFVGRFDLESREVTHQVQVGRGNVQATFIDGIIWATTTRSITRFDASTGEIIDVLPLGSNISAVPARDGSIWLTQGREGNESLVRLDPDTLQPTHQINPEIKSQPGPFRAFAARDSLWINNGSTVIVVDTP